MQSKLRGIRPEEIEAGKAKRAGLIATNSIRGGANRKILDRIKASGDIFMAWSDEPWTLEGAAVRVSIVGFDEGLGKVKVLNGRIVSEITSSLASGTDVAVSQRLPENFKVGFIGDSKKGSFDVDNNTAQNMLEAPVNPNGRPNSDVVVPWANGLDVTERPRNYWIIDFGVDTDEADAAEYVVSYNYLVQSNLRTLRLWRR